MLGRLVGMVWYGPSLSENVGLVGMVWYGPSLSENVGSVGWYGMDLA